MSYLVTISFQVNNFNAGVQAQIKQKLTNLGFSQEIKGEKGTSPLPSNTYVGEFNGENTAKVRDDLIEPVTIAFKSTGAKGSFFLTVGQNWGWSLRGI